MLSQTWFLLTCAHDLTIQCLGGGDGPLRSHSETVCISTKEKEADQSFLGGLLQLNAKNERNETKNQFLRSRKGNLILVEKYCNVDFSEAKQNCSL